MTQDPQPPNAETHDTPWLQRQWARVRSLTRRDVIITQVGEGAQNVAAGKNIFQINVAGRNITPYILIIMMASLLLAGLIGYPFAHPYLFPTKMSKGFNIAVAPIGIKDAGGHMRHSEFGDAISQSIYSQLTEAYTSASDKEILNREVEIWPATGKDRPLPTIEGDTEAARTASAEKLASDLNADMVVYGYLSDETKPESLTLELYYDQQERAGEVNPTWGSYRFGVALSPPAPYAADPGNAKMAMNELLTPRPARALFWITQGLAYQLIDRPEKSLAILKDAEADLKDWPEQDGKEVLYLFMGSAAMLGRDYVSATQYLTRSLELDGDYIPALLTLGGVYLDQAQLFPYRDRPVPPEQAGCFNAFNIENASPTLDAAIANTQQAIDLLGRAAELARTSDWQPLYYRSEMMLGQAYRLMGQWQIYQAVQPPTSAQAAQYFDTAQETLDEAERHLSVALDGFPPATQPVYHAWTQVGLAVTNQLRADIATRTQTKLAAVPWFEQARDHYQQCVDLHDETAGNIVFQNKVLKCACIPYRDDVQRILSDTLGVKP